MARRFCALSGDPDASLPVFYGYRGPCPGPSDQEPLPLPEPLLSQDLSLPDLGFPVLVPEGLILHLNPYQSWGLAMGPASVSVDLVELADMGASMALWGR